MLWVKMGKVIFWHIQELSQYIEHIVDYVAKPNAIILPSLKASAFEKLS
jgi:hypothetical protein